MMRKSLKKCNTVLEIVEGAGDFKRRYPADAG